jgi:hypothetical protein
MRHAALLHQARSVLEDDTILRPASVAPFSLESASALRITGPELLQGVIIRADETGSERVITH